MCWKTIKDEFSKAKFLLDYDQPSAFAVPVCRSPSLFYVAYRVLVSLYVCAVLIYGLTQYRAGILVTFTYWSFIVLCVTSAIQAGLAIHHYLNALKVKSTGSDNAVTPCMPVMYRLEWVCCNIVMVSAPLLALIYWTLLYEGGTVKFDNATVHGFNGVYALLDRCITALPVRLLHTWHIMLYGAVYAVFTAIHYAAGGAPIYPMLDYENDPGLAVGFLLGLIFICGPLGHFLMFLITVAREAIRERWGCCPCCCRDKYQNEEVKQGDVEAGVDNKGVELDETAGGKSTNKNSNVGFGMDNPAMALAAEE